MLRFTTALAGTVLLSAALAACDDSPSGSNAPMLITDPDEMELFVGQNAPVVSQVIRYGNTVQSPYIAYWSRDLSVAWVGPDGVVSAVAPGTTTILARYDELVDSVVVSVKRDTRAQLSTLDIIPGEVSGATHGPYVTLPFVALDGYGRTACTPDDFTLRFNPVIAGVSNSSWGNVCTLTVVPAAEGQSWVVASAGGRADSVLVTVENGAYQAAFTEDVSADAVAGVPRPLTVRILTPQGGPVPGRAVLFSAAVGTLTQSTAVTDAAGRASVTWTPPTNLGASGGLGTFWFTTSYPTGAVASGFRSVRLVGSTPIALDWYWNSSYNPSVTYLTGVTGSLVLQLKDGRTVYAIGRDVYGNRTAVTPQVTYTVLTDSITVATPRREARCASDVTGSGQKLYYSCYAGYTFHASAPGRLRMYATLPGVPTDSLDVIFAK